MTLTAFSYHIKPWLFKGRIAQNTVQITIQRDQCYQNSLSYLVDSDLCHEYCCPPFEQLGPVSNEEKFTVHKIPTEGKYLIENDSIGPPATQKIR